MPSHVCVGLVCLVPLNTPEYMKFQIWVAKTCKKKFVFESRHLFLDVRCGRYTNGPETVTPRVSEWGRLRTLVMPSIAWDCCIVSQVPTKGEGKDGVEDHFSDDCLY
jgi:hypothetical protein